MKLSPDFSKLIQHVISGNIEDQTDWIDARIADVFTFRNGKAIQFRSFADELEALTSICSRPESSTLTG